MGELTSIISGIPNIWFCRATDIEYQLPYNDACVIKLFDTSIWQPIPIKFETLKTSSPPRRTEHGILYDVSVECFVPFLYIQEKPVEWNAFVRGVVIKTMSHMGEQYIAGTQENPLLGLVTYLPGEKITDEKGHKLSFKGVCLNPQMRSL